MAKWILTTHYKITRHIARLPHWARDILDMASYINFFGLIPTVTVLATAPRHFFRRLPQVLRGRKKQYRTPIKFFSNAGSLFILLFFLRHQFQDDVSGNADPNSLSASIIEPDTALWFMLILIPLTPILMACLAVILWVIFQLPRLIPPLPPFPGPSPHYLRLPVSLKVFFALDKAKFFWSLFYISIYFVATWQFAQIIIVYGIKFLNLLLEIFETKKGIVELILSIIVFVTVAYIVYGLVFRPYAETLRACLKKPIALLFHADVHDLTDFIYDFFETIEKGRLDLASQIDLLISRTEIPLTNLENSIRIQDFDYREVENIETIKQERSAIIRSACQIERLRDMERRARSLPEQSINQLQQLLTRIEKLA